MNGIPAGMESSDEDDVVGFDLGPMMLELDEYVGGMNMNFGNVMFDVYDDFDDLDLWDQDSQFSDDDYGDDFFIEENERTDIFRTLEDSVPVLNRLTFHKDSTANSSRLPRTLPNQTETYETLHRVLEELELLLKIWRKRIHHPFTAHLQRPSEKKENGVDPAASGSGGDDVLNSSGGAASEPVMPVLRLGTDYNESDVESDMTDFPGLMFRSKETANEALTKKKYCQSTKLYYEIFESELDFDRLLGQVRAIRKYVFSIAFGLFKNNVPSEKLPNEIWEKIWKHTQTPFMQQDRSYHSAGVRSSSRKWILLENERITDLFASVGNLHIMVFEILYKHSYIMRMPPILEMSTSGGQTSYTKYMRALFFKYARLIQVKYARLHHLEDVFKATAAKSAESSKESSAKADPDHQEILPMKTRLEQGLYKIQEITCVNQQQKPQSQHPRRGRSAAAPVNQFDAIWGASPSPRSEAKFSNSICNVFATLTSFPADSASKLAPEASWGGQGGSPSLTINVFNADDLGGEQVVKIKTGLTILELNFYSNYRGKHDLSNCQFIGTRHVDNACEIYRWQWDLSTLSKQPEQSDDVVDETEPESSDEKKPNKKQMIELGPDDKEVRIIQAPPKDNEEQDLLFCGEPNYTIFALTNGSYLLLQYYKLVDQMIWSFVVLDKDLAVTYRHTMSIIGNVKIFDVKGAKVLAHVGDFGKPEKFVLFDFDKEGEDKIVAEYIVKDLCELTSCSCIDADEEQRNNQRPAASQDNDNSDEEGLVQRPACKYSARFDLVKDQFVFFREFISGFVVYAYKGQDLPTLSTKGKAFCFQIERSTMNSALFSGDLLFGAYKKDDDIMCPEAPGLDMIMDLSHLEIFAFDVVNAKTTYPMLSIARQKEALGNMLLNECSRTFFYDDSLETLSTTRPFYLPFHFASETTLVLKTREDMFLRMDFASSKQAIAEYEAEAMYEIQLGKERELARNEKIKRAKRQAEEEKKAIAARYIDQPDKTVVGALHSWRFSYGFAKPKGEAKIVGDVFVHISDMTNRGNTYIRNGQFIEFNVTTDSKTGKLRAKNVKLIDRPEEFNSSLQPQKSRSAAKEKTSQNGGAAVANGGEAAAHPPQGGHNRGGRGGRGRGRGGGGYVVRRGRGSRGVPLGGFRGGRGGGRGRGGKYFNGLNYTAPPQ